MDKKQIAQTACNSIAEGEEIFNAILKAVDGAVWLEREACITILQKYNIPEHSVVEPYIKALIQEIKARDNG